MHNNNTDADDMLLMTQFTLFTRCCVCMSLAFKIKYKLI